MASLLTGIPLILVKPEYIPSKANATTLESDDVSSEFVSNNTAELVPDIKVPPWPNEAVEL